MTPLAVIAGAIIIALAFTLGRGDGVDRGQNPDQPVAVDIKDVKTEGAPFIGSATAPVTMAVWFDYQCGFCKQYDATTIPAIIASHVDSGKVKIVYKDFQFFPGSEDVAVFGRAMWEAYPDHYYTWHKGVMALPTGEGSGLTVARAKEVAAGIAGVDANRVEQLATEKRAEYLAAVQADRQEGAAFGINGTPSTIIGTMLLAGAQPAEGVAAALDAELGQ